jgi:prolyl 4-hydroxylase
MSPTTPTTESAPESSTAPPRLGASPKVAEAEHWDSTGDHDRAVSLLAEACQQGDAEAMTRLGKRLLVAANAPYSPVEGTALLAKAAELGGADAAAQLAVLSAIGMHVKQSWDASLAAIVFSAERGSPKAQGQLRVLASDRELATRTVDVGPTLWGRLASTIDLNRWHNPSAGANLNESPLVRHFPDFATAEVCRWMIESSRGRLARAQVYDTTAKKATVSSTRTNTWAVFNVTHSDLVSVLIQVHMCAHVGLPFRHLEPLTVLHYDVGEEISEHFDFIDPNTPSYEQELAQNGQRIVTFLIYLNDDYTGGETEMPELGISHKGRRGEGLFFVNAFDDGAADTRTIHAGRPTTRGDKWIVSQFIRSRSTF